LDALFEPLVDFLIALPEFHWKKEIGNAKIGASFGLDFLNRIHLRIGYIHAYSRVYNAGQSILSLGHTKLCLC
jgi:hypothetical protein